MSYCSPNALVIILAGEQLILWDEGLSSSFVGMVVFLLGTILLLFSSLTGHL